MDLPRPRCAPQVPLLWNHYVAVKGLAGALALALATSPATVPATATVPVAATVPVTVPVPATVPVTVTVPVPATSTATVPARGARTRPQVAVNRFGLDAYAVLRSQPGNLALSPASIYLALSLLHAGAGGDSADDLADALHLGRWKTGALDAAYGAWIDELTPELDLANGLWLKRGSKLRPSFRKRMEGKFRAEIATVDFASAPEAQRVAINAWVAAHTADMIPELLGRGSIDDDTEVILVNAVHFLGRWTEPFPSNNTYQADFHLAGGATATVPMMFRSGAARYADTGDARVLEMAYRDSPLAMMVVLPGAERDLDALEDDLSPATLQRWGKALKDLGEIEIRLPRFTVDQRLDLGPLLGGLGLGSLLERLDTSRMFASTCDLALSRAVHQTVIDVNEQGTEAAAATALGVARGVSRRVAPPRFTADRPFLWMIRDTRSGALLFMGRFSDPR